jgi:hypothetical protein
MESNSTRVPTAEQTGAVGKSKESSALRQKEQKAFCAKMPAAAVEYFL